MRSKKAEPGTWKEDCGCIVDTFRYHRMCSRHQTESDEIHNRWAADKKRLEEARSNS
jgi:hypothetical protein